MPTVNGIETPIGCYVDSHYGQYADDVLADIASSFGWETSNPLHDPREIRKMWDEGKSTFNMFSLWDYYHESSSFILEWLNENTDQDHTWIWSDGEVYLVRIDTVEDFL